MTIERQTADIGGGNRISYREVGEGAPLVLLHGIGSSSQSWSAQLEAFGGDFRTIAWDAPGYGDSTNPRDAAPSAADYADGLVRLLDRLSVTRCHLVGHSLGGLMAAAFARAEPGRLLSLTLADCAAGHAALDPAEREHKLQHRLREMHCLGPRGMARQRAGRLVSDKTTADVIERIADVIATLRPDGYEQAARMLADAEVFADLAEFDKRTGVLVICGTDDRITSPDSNRRIAEAIEGARFELIPDAGHLSYVEQPAAFNAVLRRFLAEMS